MRLLVALTLAFPLAAATVAQALAGNPLAWGLAIGFASPILAIALLAMAPARPLPRKADPAKIARLERELGIEPPSEGTWPEQNTVAAPPIDAQHCPRDAVSVWAHRCRVCGADRGQACVPFLKPTTLHRAPQWGRKIGP